MLGHGVPRPLTLIRRLFIGAVAQVEVGESLELFVGCFLDGYQVGVSAVRRADELVELALKRGDLT